MMAASPRASEAVREALAEAFGATLAWFGRPEELRAFRPASGGWSIGEVLEHVSLTTHFLLIVARNSRDKALRRAARGVLPFEEESDLALLEPIGRRGAFEWARPEHMVPTGEPSAEEVREKLLAQRAECLGIIDSLGPDNGRLHRVRMSVNDSGKLDIYQWLYFVAMHANRHLAQMAEAEAEWNAARGQ